MVFIFFNDVQHFLSVQVTGMLRLLGYIDLCLHECLGHLKK